MMSLGKSVLNNLLYSSEHVWIKKNSDGSVTCGLTDFAQNNLGDIVFVELVMTRGSVSKGDIVVIVESAKAASDVFSPIHGEIIEVNTAVEINPEILNESPYDKGWLFKIAISDNSELDALMTSDVYAKFIENN